MTTRVFYEQWQLQCCGTEFSVGDSVKWTAAPAEANDLGVEWFEEHHMTDSVSRAATISGTVVAVERVRQRYVHIEPDGPWMPVEGAVLPETATIAKKWMPKAERDDGIRFIGYRVTITEETIVG